ncbi:MAG: helicase, partial [Gemmatimonadales bacterium]|nr:helicase [Gemmatimonadales bacterium]
MTYNPTDEQAAIIDAFRCGKRLVVQAGAGTGKSSTLRMLAGSTTRRGRYIAYNAAIVAEAKKTFPGNVRSTTGHGLAYPTVGNLYKHRLNMAFQPGRVVAGILGINSPVGIADDLILAPTQIARLAKDAVGRFSKTADPELQAWHVPTPTGVTKPEEIRAVRDVVLPYATRVWAD